MKNNKIDDLAAKSIAEAIKSGKVTSLDLSNNKISHQSLSILGEACKSENNKLRHFDLSGNNI